MWRWIYSGGAFQACTILFGAAFAIAVSIAAGSIAFGRVIKDWPSRFVTGAGLLSLTVFIICCAGLVYPAVFLALGAATLFWCWRAKKSVSAAPLKFSNYLPGVVFALYFILYFFNATAPEASPDGAAYHLSFVARYLREHGFHRITWNMYASLSQGVEMLFLFAFAIGRHSAAALVHFAFLVAVTWQMIDYGRRHGFTFAGACAAFLFFASPVVGIDGTSAYNDVAAAAVAFTLFSLLQIWETQKSTRLLAAIGIVAGFGYAVKYTLWTGVLYAVIFIAWKSRRSGAIKNLTVVAASASVMVLPWMLKNWIWVRNPISPFFNNIFQNPFVSYSFEVGYRHDMATYDLPSRWRIPMEAAISGGLAGILGPVFLLSPIALLALRRREGRQLLLAALVFGANYFGNIGTRFLIPVLPFVALAMMLALGSEKFGRTVAVALALAHAILSWPTVLQRYAQPGIWALKTVNWRDALRFHREEPYLKSHLSNYGVDRLIEYATTPGATVFSFQPIPEAYTSRRILVDYESEPNHIDGLMLHAGFDPAWKPEWRARFAFPRQSLRAIRIVQTSKGASPWRIHELRAFDGSTELPRSAWRTTADPFPWGTKRMTDGNLVTFWEGGEDLRPGMFVEADFSAAQQLDSVMIQTTPNQPDLRLELLGLDQRGQWKQLSTSPAMSESEPADLRRAAIKQLERNGIGYLLIFAGDPGADDFQSRAAQWGIRETGSWGPARLYQLQ